jgi:hypothetical protein
MLDPSMVSWFVMMVFFFLPWKSVWRTKVSLRTTFFAWSAALGRILNKYNHRKQHFIMVNSCCLCKWNEESMDHLILFCEVACALGNIFFSSAGFFEDNLFCLVGGPRKDT